jgi:ElaB/YqjD/DUF883 family membrane-anchored ribosome-binding protein
MESTHTNATQPNRTPTDTGAGSGNFVDRLVQGAHDAVDRVAAKAGPALNTMDETARSAFTSLEGKADQLATAQAELIESAREYIRGRPLTALAVAALIGALAAGVLRTR